MKSSPAASFDAVVCRVFGAHAYGQMRVAGALSGRGTTEACADTTIGRQASYAGVWGAARPPSGERAGSAHSHPCAQRRVSSGERAGSAHSYTRYKEINLCAICAS
jgi:hypothetical protein